ncbi:MAG TPA: cytochrome c oxidase assembly factor Coa1 family protein [Planctomycetota bacterium]|nr:cytochrome c oxidase assembly factor Coa1 family protein [Planctomycetota bacterium]
MNVPPAPPPPHMQPPPPPPPKKSSALKWILIGCGGLGFIGLLVCGGCLLWGVNLTRSVLEIREEVEKLVEASPEIREEIGDVKEVKQLGEHEAGEPGDIVYKYQVKGSKGEGTAHAKVRFSLTKFTLKSVTYDLKDGRTLTLKQK